MKKENYSIKSLHADNPLICRRIEVWVLVVLGLTGFSGTGPLPEESKDRLLHVDVFLQGLYDIETHQMRQTHDFGPDGPVPKYSEGVADMITISLHAAVDYEQHQWGDFHAYKKTVPLSCDGRAIISIPEVVNGENLEGDFWISVDHRNHLNIVSRKPIFISGAGPFYYDFITGEAQGQTNGALADNQYYLGIAERHGDETHAWAMYVGDILEQGLIGTPDRNALNNALLVGLRGYVTQDINGDGVVNILDRSLLAVNLLKGLVTVNPGNAQ